MAVFTILKYIVIEIKMCQVFTLMLVEKNNNILTHKRSSPTGSCYVLGIDLFKMVERALLRGRGTSVAMIAATFVVCL